MESMLFHKKVSVKNYNKLVRDYNTLKRVNSENGRLAARLERILERQPDGKKLVSMAYDFKKKISTQGND